MRPATIHLVAQLIRHLRGVVTTVEKFVAQTPPEVIVTESTEAIYRVRGVLMALEDALVHAPVSDRTVTASTPDRPAPEAVRSSGS